MVQFQSFLLSLGIVSHGHPFFKFLSSSSSEDYVQLLYRYLTSLTSSQVQLMCQRMVQVWHTQMKAQSRNQFQHNHPYFHQPPTFYSKIPDLRERVRPNFPVIDMPPPQIRHHANRHYWPEHVEEPQESYGERTGQRGQRGQRGQYEQQKAWEGRRDQQQQTRRLRETIKAKLRGLGS